MVGSGQQKVMAEFYKKVFGKAPDMEENGWAGWTVGKGFFGVGEHSAVKGKSKEPERIMFNLETSDVQGEFKRISEIGAVVVKEPYKMGESWIATFADPDGNYFHLMTPWKG